MANKHFFNENATPQREICLLLLETTEVNIYLCQGMIWEEPNHLFLLLATTRLFQGTSFYFSHLVQTRFLLNRPVIFELKCFTFGS